MEDEEGVDIDALAHGLATEEAAASRSANLVPVAMHLVCLATCGGDG